MHRLTAIRSRGRSVTGRFTIEKVKPGIRQFTAIQIGYRMEELKLWSGTIVPALGITVEF